ncbi:MAG: Hint domain-containing protein, partial [Rhodospirillales bacterium]|nr:Hint domain-containing protein [Rhodospirillales bacterium]
RRVGAGTLSLGSALDGAGTITVAAGAALTAAQLGGSLDIVVGSGATLQVGTLGGHAVVTVEAGARVSIAALSGAPTIDYAAAPALVALPGTGALPVTLQNLGSGDLLDFVGVSSSVPSSGLFVQPGAAAASGSLAVTGASGDSANLPFSSALPYVAFSVAPDASGGTLVTAAACYRAGTRIATARGEVKIEHLRRGDLIRTLSGRFVRALWLGRRRIDCRRLARPEQAWPVRVAAHAFAPGQPARDLYLSPDHAVFVDGALVPVRYLVNGASIAQRPVGRVEYWHVELPAHDVVLAEGLPAESYLDTGNRAAFAGIRYRRPLPPAAALRLWRRRACAPLLASGPALAALHARLLARAGSLGHALTGSPALRVLADGRPARGLGEGRFRLPSGTREVRVLSRSFVPAHLAGPGGDARRLGVAVAQVRLDGAALALDDARLARGWYAPEAGWRWTGGEAVIAAEGAREIALSVAIAGRYWRAA